MEVTHFRLLVSRFSECFRFYRDVLGLETSFPDDGGPYAEFKVGGEKYLGLFDRVAMAHAMGDLVVPSDVRRYDRFALVLHVDDVDAKEQELRAAGVRIHRGATDRPEWGLRTVHLRDPDGNLIELWSPPVGGDGS